MGSSRGSLDPAEHRQIGRMARRIGANIPMLDMRQADQLGPAAPLLGAVPDLPVDPAGFHSPSSREATRQPWRKLVEPTCGAVTSWLRVNCGVGRDVA